MKISSENGRNKEVIEKAFINVFASDKSKCIGSVKSWHVGKYTCIHEFDAQA